MACAKCKKVKRKIPTRCDPPLTFQEHEWVGIRLHNNREFCKKCRVARRTNKLMDINDPCPGRPPWLEIGD